MGYSCSTERITFQVTIIALVLLQIRAPLSVYAVDQPTGLQLDTQGLLTFKQIIEKDPYGVLDGWGASANCCEWRGVSCSSGRVVGIDLNDGGLLAPLPVAPLAPLDQLQELRLRGNEFYGFGTEQVVASACSTLTVLDLSSNNLTGSFTGSSKVLCTRLAHLNLSHNAYLGTLVNFGILGQGSSIVELDLSFNNYSGPIPARFFSECGIISWVDLSHNSLSGDVPAGVSLCSSLLHLDLSYNLLNSSLPPDIIIVNSSIIPPLPSANSTAGLIYLNLSSNQLSGRLPDALNSPVLTSLDLSSNIFTGPIPPSLSSSTTLTLLNLSSNSLSGPLPRSLSNLVNLQGLYLGNNNLTGPIPPEFGNAFTSMVEFDLSMNQLVGTIPTSFSNCSFLHNMKLGNNFLSGEFPKAVACSIPALQMLDLSFNNLTGTLPAGGLPDCKLLTMLDLSANDLEGSVPGDFCAPQLQQLLLQDNNFNGPVPAGLGNCTTLTILDLSCNRLSGPLPPALPRQLTFLQELMMWGNSLTGPIPPTFGSTHHLRKLILNLNHLSGTIPVTLGNCTNLEWLSLSSNLLTGAIPLELGSLTLIGILQLANNSLSGSIPATLGNSTRLVWLDLNSNLLEGTIPVELMNQAGKITRGTLDQGTEYTFLKYMGSNCAGLGGLLEYDGIRDKTLFQLSAIKGSCNVTRLYHGTDPYYFNTFGSLEYLDLGYNRLSGPIPSEIGSLSYLLVLSLSHNVLIGPIPDTLSNLLRMTILYLDHNMLDGPIPPSLAKLGLLNQLNLSNNNLSGPIPDTGTMSTMPASVFANNPSLCGAPLLPCGYTPTSDNSSSSTDVNRGSRYLGWSVVAIVMSAIGGLAMVMACMSGMAACFVAHRHKMRRNVRDNYMDNLPSGHGSDSWNISGASEPLSINVATFEKPLRKLTFAHLLEATNGFNKDAIIGQGGFGDVYKATLEGGKVVAIKKLIHTVGQGDREFIAEMETIGKIKHRNLVPLLGYCKVGKERLLVYEYMEGGSLDKRLYGDCSTSQLEANGSSPEHQRPRHIILTWEMRKRVALGTARGLCFLHHSCIPHIIHRDLKSSNVLLDDASEARVSDFGMARLVSAAETHLSVSSVVGTPGYVPPEYCHSFRCTAKGDVYSFGVVLLELVTGMRPTWSLSSNCKKRTEQVLSESQTSASPSTSISDDTSTSTTTTTPKSTTRKKIELEEDADNGIDLVGWVERHRKEGKDEELLDQRVLNRGGTLLGISPPSWVVEKEMLRYLDIACRCVDQSPHRRPTMLQVVALFQELHPDQDLDAL